MDRRVFRTTFIGALLSGAMLLGPSACSTQDEQNEGLRVLSDSGIEQIAFISRAKRTDVGDVFQYTSFSVDPKSANIFKLGTVSGGAEPVAITPFGTGDWAAADIMAMDVSFDGDEIVFSARLEGESNYSLWRIKIDGSNPEEPGEMGPARVFNGPFDAVYPIYLPKERIFFMTNQTIAPGVKQFRDEYERGTTAQAATINVHGGDLQLGPRNLSHRVSPTLAAIQNEEGGPLQGKILHTNWDHLTNVNEGNLMVMNPDLTGGAEFYGKEGSGVANSYLKPRQVNNTEFLAIATDRQDTFQSGAIIKIDRGKNEADATTDILTPDVPRDKEPSFDKIGRYYDAYPVTDGEGELTHVLTSWANGPVQSEVAGGGMSEDGVDYGEGAGPPDFGLYVLEPKTNKRLPIFNDSDMWDVMPMAIGSKRPEPTAPSAPSADDAPDGTALIGALNVFESSLSSVPSDPGSVDARTGFRIRVIEGFSVEEGIPDDFGLTESDGAILLGEAPVHGDGSFAAYVPEDRPIHLQLVNPYGLSVVNEDRWFSADAGEDRFCGGCHEERGSSSLVNPGLSEAMGEGPENFALPYEQRAVADAASKNYADMVGKVVNPEDPGVSGAERPLGMPWDIAVQPIFDDAGCADCHNGTPGPANPTITVTDTMSPDAEGFTWTFNLGAEMVEYEQGLMAGYFTASHISLLIMSGMESEEGIEIETDPTHPYQAYMVPENGYESVLMRYLQPHRLYPTEDVNDIAFDGVEKNEPYLGQTYDLQHPSESTPGFDPNQHRVLTKYEKYVLGIVADLGGQYYAIENAPGEDY